MQTIFKTIFAIENAACDILHLCALSDLCLFIYREVKDACFIPEKVSSKMAKDLFEQNQDYEQKFKRLFAGLFTVLLEYLS